MDLAERPPEPFPPEPPLPEPPPVPPPAPEPPPQPGPRARENANRPTVYSDRVRGVRSTDRGDREIPHSPLAVNAQEVVAVRDPRRHTDRGREGCLVIVISFEAAWIVVLSVGAWLVIRAKPRP